VRRVPGWTAHRFGVHRAGRVKRFPTGVALLRLDGFPAMLTLPRLNVEPDG